MEIETKIEALKKVSERLTWDNKASICYFFHIYVGYWRNQENLRGWRGFAYRHLGDVLKKHKPKHKKLYEFWFELDDDGAKQRKKIVDEVILELQKDLKNDTDTI